MKVLITSAACLTVATIAVVGFTATGGVGPEADTPDGAIRGGIDALRDNDVHRFLELTLSPERLDEMETAWDEDRTQDFTSEEETEFADSMKKLIAPGAEDALYEEWLPEFEELKPQVQMMAGMMVGMAQASLNESEDLSYEEREQAQAVLGAMGKVLMSDALTSDANLRSAARVICETARRLDVEVLDDVTSLDFETAMDRAGIALEGAKELGVIYGLDLDAFLDSLHVEKVSEEGDSAVVRMTYEFFDREDVVELEMRRSGGRWFYSED